MLYFLLSLLSSISFVSFIFINILIIIIKSSIHTLIIIKSLPHYYFKYINSNNNIYTINADHLI